MSNGMMTGNDAERSDYCLLKVLAQYSPGGLRKPTKSLDSLLSRRDSNLEHADQPLNKNYIYGHEPSGILTAGKFLDLLLHVKLCTTDLVAWFVNE
jgi:hypothetical protein